LQGFSQNRQQAFGLIPRTSRTTIHRGVEHRRIEPEQRPKITTTLVARRELLALGSDSRDDLS
jgi:hypothetical protein